MTLKLNISEFSVGSRPQVKLPGPLLWEHLKEEGIRRMVSDHYDALVRSEIRDLFPSDEPILAQAKKNSADFFIQLCGGPDYFNQNRGEPKMVIRHAPFKITAKARVVWLECYRPVLAQLDAPIEVVQSFWDYLDGFSFWMINTPG